MNTVDGGVAVAAIDGNEIGQFERSPEYRDVEQFFLGKDGHASPEKRNDDGRVNIRNVVRHEDVGLIRVEALSADDAGANSREPNAATCAPHSELPKEIDSASDERVRKPNERGD